MHAVGESVVKLDLTPLLAGWADDSKHSPRLRGIGCLAISRVPGELETGLRVGRVDSWKRTAGDVADEVSIRAEPDLAAISPRRFDVGSARRQISGRLCANLELSALDLLEELD